MEAAELARWTRFAAKGGIGKCTAVCDCVAENPGDLMFLKDDEITVLMQIVEKPGTYVGYCEGVVGRFQTSDVKFHSKLKKLVKTKRSSLSAASHTPGKSPTSSNGSNPNSPALLPTDSRRARVSLDDELASSIRPFASSPIPLSSSELATATAKRAPSRDRNSKSRLEDLVAVTPDIKDVPFPVRSPSPLQGGGTFSPSPLASSPEPISRTGHAQQPVALPPLPQQNSTFLEPERIPTSPPPPISQVQHEVDPVFPDIQPYIYPQPQPQAQPLPPPTLPSIPPIAIVPQAVAPLRTSSLKSFVRPVPLKIRASLASSRHESVASTYSQDDEHTVLGHGAREAEHPQPPETIIEEMDDHLDLNGSVEVEVEPSSSFILPTPSSWSSSPPMQTLLAPPPLPPKSPAVLTPNSGHSNSNNGSMPTTSTSAFFGSDLDRRMSIHSDGEDGETGIGLSLLQNLADGDGFGGWSDSDEDEAEGEAVHRPGENGVVRRKSSQKSDKQSGGGGGGSIKRTKSGRSTRSNGATATALMRNGSAASSNAGLVYGSDFSSGSEDGEEEEGLRYDDSEGGHDTVHDHDYNRVVLLESELPATKEEDALEDDLDRTHAQFANYPYSFNSNSVFSSPATSPTMEEEGMTFPPIAPLSPNRNGGGKSRPSPTTFVFPSPPSHTPHASIPVDRRPTFDPDRERERERRPSIARSQASTVSFRDGDSVDDESMMDIYDNYRYSRFSVGGVSLGGSSVGRASGRRMSAASRRMSVSRTSTSSKQIPAMPSVENLDMRDVRPRGDSVLSAGTAITSDSKRSMDLPNPFDLAGHGSGDERPRPTRSRSNTSASSGPRSVMSATTSPLPSPPLPGMHGGPMTVYTSGGMKGDSAPGSPLYQSTMASSRGHERAESEATDGSMYTQEQEGESMRGSEVPPGVKAAIQQQLQHRPVPLDLANPSKKLSMSTATATTASNGDLRSPLLHTTWTPLTSPPPEGTGTIDQNLGYTGTGDGFVGKRIEEEDMPENAIFSLGVGEGGKERLNQAMSGAGKEDAEIEKEKEKQDKERRIVIEEDDEDEVVIGRPDSVRVDSPTTMTTPPPAGAVDRPTSTTAISIQRPPTLAAPGQPMARPPRPSLAELRGAEPGEPGGMRQSLFLPHPNAPKAPPSMASPGPMYIQQHIPPPPQPHGRGGAIPTIRMALSIPPRGFNAHRGPTIYGRIMSDLGAALGPVPISFTLEPPLATAPLPGSVPSMKPPSPVSPPPIRVIATPLARTPSSLVPQQSLQQHPQQQLPPLKIEERLQATDNKGAIPRANFYPKAPGMRPRSRSFSGFSSPTTEVPMPLQTSQEGSEIPSTADIKESLVNKQPRPGSPSKSSPRPNPLKISSPLARSSGSYSPVPRPQPPSSPLAHFTFPREPAVVPPSPTMLLNRPGLLRGSASRSTLQEGSPAKPMPQIRNIASDIALVGPAERPSLENDRASVRSSRSGVASPIPHGLGRQSSLRAKLSLPNLRRSTSRPEEPVSPLSEHRVGDSDTMQVKDLDFELIRPSLAHFQQAARSSEDSGVLGRDRSIDARLDIKHLRPESPAISVSSPLSPTSPSDNGSSTGPSSAQMNSLTTGSPRPSDPELSLEAHRHREQKWMNILSSVAASQARKSKKVKKLLLEGVPSSVRYLVWSHLTDGKSRVVPNVYGQLGARARVPAIGDIERDVSKSFTEHPHLKKSEGPVLSLLQAYLTMVPDIRYSTGLTLIAGHLLLQAPEEDAFWIFVSIMDAHLRPYFSTTPIQLEVDSALFSRGVEAADPALAKKLFADMAIPASAICRPWFTRLFVGTLPQQYLDRAWDLFFYEGIPFLLRIGLALFNCLRRKLMECTSPDAVLSLLRQPVPALLPPTPDALVSLALAAKLKDDDFKKQRSKLEGQMKRQTQATRPTGSISLPRT